MPFFKPQILNENNLEKYNVNCADIERKAFNLICDISLD